MKTKTIKVEDARKAAKAFIKEKGATRKLGAGSYGAVYSASGLDVVYKLGEYDENTGYLAYVRQIVKQKEHNPFTPKIYSITFFKDNDNCKYFVVEMERLKAMKPTEFAAARKISALMYGEELLDPEVGRLGFKIHIPKEIKDLVEMTKRAYRNANRVRGDICWDLHSANYMKRGDQLVLTDPLA